MTESFKRALFHAMDRLLDESLGEVDVGRVRLILTARAAQKLAQTEEIQTYMKSDTFQLQMIEPKADLIDCGVANSQRQVLPNRLYGFQVFVTDKAPTQTHGADASTGVYVRRCVPQAYLWWEQNKRAWTSTLEYQF